ncbi:MAG TPA: DUF2202 domain-containing protein [Candidatus Absconditabacterales bacterium]|nr:DUF2202 domain-containing protein [Candidatus Absconditabacterales bacterium]HOQ79266.1 DUF2202 domain-containing protein [Candidatus Absconditabacterales bacterium]HPK28272.1 DUF2202 domain-containing protein [Candidatus Absconditabacterales bacterium]
MKKTLILFSVLGLVLLFAGCTSLEQVNRNRLELTSQSRGSKITANQQQGQGGGNAKRGQTVRGGGQQGIGRNSSATGINHMNLVVDTGLDLTPEQISELQFIIEEEKLAQDIYQVMYDQRGDKRFNNIIKGEINHQSVIATILEAYGLENPTEGMSAGEFKNTELQQLYDDLIVKGKTSSAEAIQVGILVEEKDIVDLENMMPLFKNHPSIIQGLQILLNGSKNHLQAFKR